MIETLLSSSTHIPLNDMQNLSGTPAAVPAPLLTGISNAYYRSILFNIDHSINPLISSATPLFAVAGKLPNLLLSPDISNLYHDLVHEIKAFENKAQHHNYRAHTIMAARFALCALLDEMILNSTWGKNSAWRQHNLLNTFQQEDWDGDKFFLMLQRVSDDPAIHIDLLELMYLCLSLGFEGKYRNVERGHAQLTQIMEELYKIIQHQRGECSKRLTINPLVAKEVNKIHYPLWPALIAAILTITILCCVYCTLNYALDQQADKLLQEIYQLRAN